MSDVATIDLSREQARALTDKAKDVAAELVPLVAELYRGRAWRALGYESWDAYRRAEFPTVLVAVENRPAAVAELRGAGMSQRETAALIGVSHPTVGQIEKHLSDGRDLPSDRQTLMSSGRAYERSAPVFIQPEPEPEPEPPADDPLPPVVAEQIERRIATQVQHRPDPVWSQDELSLRAAAEAGRTVVASLRGQHNNLIQWAEQAGRYVRIDRRTDWGNPFELPGDGDRDTVIRNYRDHYLPHKPSLLSRIAGLSGQVLVCWCAPEPCHGDILAAAAEESR